MIRSTRNAFLFTAAFVCLAPATLLAQQQSGKPRIKRGLQALYDFSAAKGNRVSDVSRVGDPLHLKIDNPREVIRGSGFLTVKGSSAKIRSEKPAGKLFNAIRKTQQFSIEAWVIPENNAQDGPARIVTLSAHTSDRNFTVGQDGNKFDIRFRTDKTDANGIPSLASAAKTVTAGKLTHVVYVRNKNGDARLYLDGQPAGRKQVAGNLQTWKDSFQLAIGNEITGDRSWKGTFRLVAIFNSALTPEEVKINFTSGVRPTAAVLANAPATPKPTANSGTGKRVSKNLQALYDFASSTGPIVSDRSRVRPTMDLKISNMQGVKRSPGRLRITGNTIIKAENSDAKLFSSIRKTGEVTVEAWIQPSNTKQKGPARIVTLSKDSVNRNFTVGQEGNAYQVRLRTVLTTENGIPGLNSKSNTATTKLTHVVFTRSRSGRTRIFLNGKPAADGKSEGTLSNWDKSFQFALGDELVGGRLWLGTYDLVAVYNRQLTAKEVLINFKAGSSATGEADQTPMLAEAEPTPQERHFETVVAPLLSKHCLECHDTSTHKGGFNLAKKLAAFAGGDSGKAIIAGNLEDSSIWTRVVSDEMPENRPALSKAEKDILKNWLKDGATWSLDVIDPAVYTHDTRVARNWIRRLTVDEYIETVKATVGVDIADDARKILPGDLRADGFSNTAYNLNVDLKHVGAYAKLAEIIVSKMDVNAFAKRFSNKRSLTDRPMIDLIRKMGKWVYRGTVDEDEVTTLRGVSTTVASAGGDFSEAVSFILEAMLQSPRFIYRIENQKGDGTFWPVNDFELANRISYTIWGSSPDKELLAAAESGFDSEEVAKQVDRMLADQKAIRHSNKFYSEWLNLGRLQNMQPNKDRFPKWNRQLAGDMQSETLAFFEDIVWKQKLPLSNLLNANMTYVTPRLIKHYRLPETDESKKAKDGQLIRYDLSETVRGGMLTHGSVLTVGGDEASMVTRGLLVLHELLRGVVKDPPPCVDTTPVPTKAGLTQRSIAAERIANANCTGCHSKFEPLAFGLEKFDGLGSFHEKDEHGNKLREDGEILFPGDAKPVSFKTSKELMNLLAKSERVQESITWKLTQFALGRPLVAADAKTVDKIHKQAIKDGGTYQDLIKAIVLSDLVLTTRTETE